MFPSATPLSAEAHSAAQILFAGATTLLAHGGPHLCGEEWCLADVDLAIMLNRLALNGDSIPESLAAYALRQWQRPSVQLWVNQKTSAAMNMANIIRYREDAEHKSRDPARRKRAT